MTTMDTVFDRWLIYPPRGWWRYRRCWARRMRACGLSLVWGEALLVPRLVSVRVGESVDRLEVRMLEGQCPADYEQRGARIARTFGVLEARATIIGGGTIGIALRHAEASTALIALSHNDFRKEIAR